MDSILQDVRYGARKLAQAPGVAVVAVLMLALGIGANTATFSMVSYLLLNPLPYEEPSRLVRVVAAERETNRETGLSLPDLDDVRSRATSAAVVAGVQQRSIVLDARGEPAHVAAAAVSPEIFAALGIRPSVGRGFAPGDAEPGAAGVAVLSHAYWQRRFGADPGVIGSAIRVDGLPSTVVGILPHGVWFPARNVDVWVPLSKAGVHAQRDGRTLGAVARLAPGRTVEQLQSELEVIAADVDATDPTTTAATTLGAVRLTDAQASKARERLLLLHGAVAFVLMIACANIANLLLARASVRGREVAIRAAIGARPARIARQFLVESLMLSLAGGAAGLVVATWLLKLLGAVSPERVAGVYEIGVDGYALAFTVAISVVTGLVFGIVPAMRAARADALDTLKKGGAASATGFGRDRLRGALLVLEVALSLVLLIGAGLLTRAYSNLDEVAPGFEPRDAIAAEVILPEAMYPEASDVDAYYRAAIARVRAVAGVEAAGAVDIMPLVGWNPGARYEAEGGAGARVGTVDLQPVVPGYFRAMGIPLHSGRALDDADLGGGSHAVVVNERFASAVWPGEDAVGRRIRLHAGAASGADAPWLTVVGVVGDVRQFGLQEPARPEAYVPETRRTMTIVARTVGPPEDALAGFSAALRSADTSLPAPTVRTLEAVVEDSLAVKRLMARIFATLSVVAMLLAAIGIYGVVAYSVARRTREIGIRVALGATPRDAVRLVVAQSAALTLGGLGLGAVGALGVARLLRSYLYGVSAVDPLSYAGAIALLGAVALLAAWVPARAASRVDPAVALRAE